MLEPSQHKSMGSVESFRVYFGGYRSLSAKDLVECAHICLFFIFVFKKHMVQCLQILGNCVSLSLKFHFSRDSFAVL